MRPGGSKQKGAAFERKICQELSLWVTGGKSADCFWRSAMSGGRATVAARRGKKLSRQAGDISAVAPEGHILTDRYYVELKHVKKLDLLKAFTKNTGPLAEFWRTAKREAHRYGKEPLIIARQNNLPTILMCATGEVGNMTGYEIDQTHLSIKKRRLRGIEIWRLNDVLACAFKLEGKG